MATAAHEDKAQASTVQSRVTEVIRRSREASRIISVLRAHLSVHGGDGRGEGRGSGREVKVSISVFARNT